MLLSTKGLFIVHDRSNCTPERSIPVRFRRKEHVYSLRHSLEVIHSHTLPLASIRSPNVR